MTSQPVVVSNNIEHNRYEASIGDQVAGSAFYRLDGEQVVFTHTEVDPAWEGHGVGSALAKWALDDVIAAGKTIVPRCPFIAAFIKRHPAYLDSVDAGYRAQLS